jgi:hypothetical protein
MKNTNWTLLIFVIFLGVSIGFAFSSFIITGGGYFEEAFERLFVSYIVFIYSMIIYISSRNDKKAGNK